MGGLALFAAAAVAAVAPPTDTSRVQLSVETDVGLSHPVPTYFEDHVLSANLTLSSTWFARRPVVEDDSPLSLQPFLQRASTVSVSANIGAFATYYSPPEDSAVESQSGATLGLNLYLTHWAALTASLGLQQYSNHTTFAVPGSGTPDEKVDFLEIPLSLGFGLRWEDVRFDLSYHVTPNRSGIEGFNDDKWAKPYLGNVSVSGYLVSKRRISVAVQVDAIQSGALGSSTIHYYFTRRTSVFVGAWGGRGVLYINDTLVRERAGGVVGVTRWASRHFGFSVSYSPSWTSIPTANFSGAAPDPSAPQGALVHLFSLAFLSRAR